MTESRHGWTRTSFVAIIVFGLTFAAVFHGIGDSDVASDVMAELVPLTAVASRTTLSALSSLPSFSSSFNVKREGDQQIRDDSDYSRSDPERGTTAVLGAALLRDVLREIGDAANATDTMTNDAFCGKMRERVWKELPLLLPAPLMSAMREQLHRHEAVLNGTPLNGQKYLVWSLSGGIGNRFQSLVSTFVTAMLTQRVLLMKDWFTPLPASSSRGKPVKQFGVIHRSQRTAEYVLEDLSKLFDHDALTGRSRREKLSHLLCTVFPVMQLSEFYQLYPSEFPFVSAIGSPATASALPAVSENHVKIDISARHDKTLARWNRFLCANWSKSSPIVDFDAALGDRQSLPDSASSSPTQFFVEKFVYIWTNQYYLPGLFSNPYLRQRLDEYFPSLGKQRPYDVMLRVLVVPGLPVVRHIQGFLQRTGLRPGEFLGLHVRAFHDNAMAPLARSFDECLQQMLHTTADSESDSVDSASDDKKNNNDDKKRPRFFLATMHEPIRSYFFRKYTAQRALLQSVPDGLQLTGKAERDVSALADMMLLALAQDVLLSPGSTFGMFVAAYGGPQAPTRVDYAQSSTRDRCVALKKGTQPCFGSWFNRDKIFHRRSSLSCQLLPLPSWVQTCN